MLNTIDLAGEEKITYLVFLTIKNQEENQIASDCMINTDRSKMLDSGFFENQVWGALHKAWKGYVIAKKIKMNMKKWSAMHALFKSLNMT